jgi:hypothetical protein
VAIFKHHRHWQMSLEIILPRTQRQDASGQQCIYTLPHMSVQQICLRLCCQDHGHWVNALHHNVSSFQPASPISTPADAHASKSSSVPTESWPFLAQGGTVPLLAGLAGPYVLLLLLQQRSAAAALSSSSAQQQQRVPLISFGLLSTITNLLLVFCV